jgi:hypothetical protein
MSVMIERRIGRAIRKRRRGAGRGAEPGATPVRERRLQEDCLLDTRDLALQRGGAAPRPQ